MLAGSRWIEAFIAVTTVSISIAPAGRAQCLEWKGGFHGHGTTGSIHVMTVFDDGSGPVLCAGGNFTAAGAALANDVATWTGSTWDALGSGIEGLEVNALAGFDDGSGPALYAAGDFYLAGGVSAQSIAKWDGSTWSPLGSGMFNPGRVWALAVFDDGTGPALYAGGDFQTAGGVNAAYLAKWNGSSWSAVGSGGISSSVFTLTVFDDGTGPALYVGGFTTTIAGTSVNHIAKWDGSNWSALGSGLGHAPDAMTVFDDGTGAALYVGGIFTVAGGVNANGIAKWDGSSWSALGSGVTGGLYPTVYSLATFDDGSGPALYASGVFDSAGGVTANTIAKWDGSTWSSPGNPVNLEFSALTVYDDGTGPALYASAASSNSVEDVHPFMRWDGSTWTTIGAPGAGTNDGVIALHVFDDGPAPALYAGGSFTSAGGVSASHIARWNGSSWSALGSGVGGSPYSSVWALAGFDDGTGPALYAGGGFTSAGSVSADNIAKWDGSSWSALGSGTAGSISGVVALAVFDAGTGPALYAAGSFTSAGGVSTNHVAKWDGSSWSGLGSGMDGPSFPGPTVSCLAVFDDGTGPALYAGGDFTSAGGISAKNVAKWDGSNWSPLGTGTSDAVRALTVFDDGSGPALYAGGQFKIAGGAHARYVARWNGSTWSGLGGGLDDYVHAFATFDDGSGPALYAVGYFDTAGGVSANHIARWNGSTWSALGEGFIEYQGIVRALAVFDDGSGVASHLYVGGSFSSAGTAASSNIAEWLGCGRPGEVICVGDGSGSPCPCANTGLAGHGCENSAQTGGAVLGSAGWTSLAFDSLVLTSSDELSSALSIFLQGTAQIPPAAFGDGLRCTGGSLKRLYVKHAASGTVSAPEASEPDVSVRSAALGDLIQAGHTRIYQVVYRDPDLAFCPNPQGGSWNISNGLRIGWLP